MDTLFHVEMLGRFRVCQGNREITRFRTQKTSSLLAYLALFRSRFHSRDFLIELFWPRSELKAARTNLRVALNALRRQLEPPGVPTGAVLLTDHAQVRLHSLAFTTDVEEFDKTLQQAQSESEANRRVALYIRAVDLYRGDLLPGHYEDWVFAERDRLLDVYVSALRQIVKEYGRTRQYERAIEYAHRMVQADPFREWSCRDLMRLYLAVGRPQEALYQYQSLAQLLQNELKAVPSQATRVLAQQLEQGTTIELRRYTGMDNSRKKRTQGQETPAPTPSTQHLTPRLPFQVTRFFGREEEIAYLLEILDVPYRSITPSPHHLITLTGPGGTGKTRLAIEVAARCREKFSDTLWFVPLAELDDPLRLGEALRDALQLPAQTHASALDQVIAFLNGLERSSLLILDNFEKITAGGASVVWTLLNRIPTLRCLVTSRQPLSLPGEREVPVPPLPVPGEGLWREREGQVDRSINPPLSTLHQIASVALFVDRAQAARPEFQITPRNAGAIAALCTRLEGIPLAIELAAAHANSLTPSQILDRLSERFALLAFRRADKGERHRSLWAAIDWSYHLLPPGLQRFFARLSVFRGGWSLEAAESVCEEPAALDYLSQLQGHSLVVAEESSTSMRFRMLETLREFAAEQLTLEEREQTERCHTAYFHPWVSGARWVGTSEQTAWFQRFEEDFDNLRAVLSWSLRAESEIEIGLQLAGRLYLFWVKRGYLLEGQRWYASLLEHAGDAPTTGLFGSLYGAGGLATLLGDFQAARLLLERCLEVACARGDEKEMANTHNELGSVAYRQGDYEQARMHYEKSLLLARKLAMRYQTASALGNLANVAQSIGEITVSHTLNEESLEIWREIGDISGEERTLHNLANLVHSQGQLDQARAYYEQGLEIIRELADPYGLSYSLTGIAGVAIDQGDYAAAAAYARESLDLARGLNARLNLVDVLYLLTELVRAIGEWAIAARMYGALKRVREEMKYPIAPMYQEAHDQIQATLQEALGKETYEAAITEGIQLSLEQALICLEATLADRSL